MSLPSQGKRFFHSIQQWWGFTWSHVASCGPYTSRQTDKLEECSVEQHKWLELQEIWRKGGKWGLVLWNFLKNGLEISCIVNYIIPAISCIHLFWTFNLLSTWTSFSLGGCIERREMSTDTWKKVAVSRGNRAGLNGY